MAGSVKFVSVASFFSNSLSVTTPSGTTGDTLVMTLGAYDTGSTATPPWATGNAAFTTDFTRAGSASRTSSGTASEIWSRITDGTEDATYEPALQGGTYGEFAGLIRLSASQLQATSGGVYSYSGGHRIPAHTVDTDGSMAVMVFLGYNSAVNNTTMTNAGWTRRVNEDNGYYSVYTKNVDAGTYTETNVTTDSDAVSILGIFEPDPTPNTIASDDFNRANGGLGSNWTTITGSDTPTIVSNQVAGSTNTGDNDAAYWDADTFDTDQWAEADLSKSAGDGACGLVLRGNASGDYYFCDWNYANSGRYSLFRYIHSTTTYTKLAEVQNKGNTGTRTMRMEIVGSTITVWVDGVEEISYTDSSPITTGKPGVVSSRTANYVDNFSAGDWTAVTPPTVRSTAENVGSTGAVTTFTVTRPTTYSAGDRMIVAFYIRATGVTGVSIPGFTTRNPDDSLAETANTGSGDRHLFLLDKELGASEPSSYTATVSGSFTVGYQANGQMVVDPCYFNGSAMNSSSSSSSVTVPAVMQYADGGLIVSSSYNDSANLPSGFTSQLSYDGGSGRLATKTQDIAGLSSSYTASGTATWMLACHAIYTTNDPTPNTIATDDFNRANGGLGANWTTIASAPQIVSNTVQGPSNSTEYTAAWTADTFDNDQWAEVDATLGAGPYNEADVGVRLANGGSGTDGYFLVWTQDATDEYAIWKVENGSWTRLGVAVGTTSSGTRRLRIEAVGTTITGYVDGVEVISRTDSTFTSGNPGISLYDTADTATLDNFSAGDWTTGGGGPTTHSITASGATTATGSAAINVTRPVATSGATTTTGSASIGRTLAGLSASGSTTTTGSAAIEIAAITHALTASGSTTTTGTAAINATRPVSSSGATTTTGSATINATRPLSATGSTTTTGSAAIAIPSDPIRPVVIASLSSGNNTALATQAAGYPAYSTGDLIIQMVAIDSARGVTVPSAGPNSETIITLSTGVDDGSTISAAAWAWVATAGASAGSLNFDVTPTGEQVSVECIVIDAGTFNATTPFPDTLQSSFNSADSSSPTSPNLPTTVAGSLPVVFVAGDTDPQTSMGASGWTQVITHDQGAASSAVYTRDTYTTASETVSFTSFTGGTFLDSYVTLAFAVAPPTEEHPITASGSTITTGSAAIGVTRPLAATASATTTGTAAISTRRPISANGSTTTAGSATIGRTIPMSASGSTTTDGSATLVIPSNVTHELTASGSTTITGSAAIDFGAIQTHALDTRYGGEPNQVVVTAPAVPLTVVRTLQAAGAVTTLGQASINIPTGYTWIWVADEWQKSTQLKKFRRDQRWLPADDGG